MHVASFRISIPLQRKFAVVGGEAAVKTNVVTVLNNRYTGEAAPSVKYGPPVEAIEAGVHKGVKMLEGLGTIGADTLEAVDGFDIHPAARSALLGMVLNYLSGESGRYPWEVLGLGTPVGVHSSVTVAIDTPEEMIKAIRAADWPIVKVKMGNEQDVLLLDALGEITDKEIRVDVNGGWSCAKAEEMIFHLAQKGVRIIEQPTAAEFAKEWPHLKGKSRDVELILDEELTDAASYQRYRDFIDGINIKMEKCGGVLEGLKLARLARADGKKVMLGCMVETSVGIAQALYMTSQADYFDLDGPLLLESDIAHGIRYEKETIEVDREIIGGPKLRRDVVDKYMAR